MSWMSSTSGDLERESSARRMRSKRQGSIVDTMARILTGGRRDSTTRGNVYAEAEEESAPTTARRASHDLRRHSTKTQTSLEVFVHVGGVEFPLYPSADEVLARGEMMRVV